MLLGVVARAFRRIAAAAGFEFQTGLGEPTATVAYQGAPANIDVDVALGSPFGAKGHQAGSDAYAFDTALGSPTAITGKSGSAEAFAIVTGMGEPTATVAYQGSAEAIEVVTEFPSIATGFSYTNTEGQTFEDNADTTGWDDDLRGDIDQLISDLKNGQINGSNVWSKCDRILLMDLPNSTDSLRYLNEPTLTATAVNSPTHTANQGFTGDGSTAYINTGYDPSTDGSNFVQDSACLGVWVRTVASGGGYYAGASGTHRTFIERPSTGAWQARGPNTGNNILAGSTAVASATGLLVANRSAAAARQVYRNGSSEGSDTQASTGVTDNDIYLLAMNFSGSPSSHVNGQISHWFAAASLTANEQADIYDAFNRYRTAREAA